MEVGRVEFAIAIEQGRGEVVAEQLFIKQGKQLEAVEIEVTSRSGFVPLAEEFGELSGIRE